jgi:hypothetical protein
MDFIEVIIKTILQLVLIQKNRNNISYFIKFKRIYSPINKSLDCEDNFRDPFVYPAKVIVDYFDDHCFFRWTNLYQLNNDNGI